MRDDIFNHYIQSLLFLLKVKLKLLLFSAIKHLLATELLIGIRNECNEYL